MRPTPVQRSRVVALLQEVVELRIALDADGQNDLGAELSDAAAHLNCALDMIDGRTAGQMDGQVKP